MPKKRKRSESNYYKPVERFLKRQFGCSVTTQNKGTRFGRIDVIGMRDIGGEMAGAVEILAVEVKAGNQPFNTATGQAYGYSVYADRCYLADLRNGRRPFDWEERDIASKLGVGLLAIRSNGRVDEILASPKHVPLIHMRMQLIEKLRYAQCTLCGSIFDTGKARNWWARLSRSMKNALKKNRGLVYWLPEMDVRKHDKALIYERRYICPDCIQNVLGQLSGI